MATKSEPRHDARGWIPAWIPGERGRAFHPAPFFALAAAGALFGRAALLGALAPFGPALVAAVDWTWGLGPASAALAGVVAGAVGARGDLAGLEALLLSGAAIVYTRTRGAAPAGSAWWGATLAAAAVLVGAPFALARAPDQAWAATLAQAVLVPLLAALLAPALASLARPARGRGEEDPAPGPDAVAVAVGVAVGCAVAVAGLGGLRAGPVDVRAVLATLMALSAAYVSGVGGGAAAGTVLGLATFLFGSGGPGIVAGWGFGGLMAGAVAPWGRLPATLGFFLAAGLAFLPTPLGELPDPEAGFGMLIGAAIFLVSPYRLWPTARLAGQGWPRPVRTPLRIIQGGAGRDRIKAGVKRAGPGRERKRLAGLAGRFTRSAAVPVHGVLAAARGVARAAREAAATSGSGRASTDSVLRFSGAFRKLAEAFEPVPWEGGKPSADGPEGDSGHAGQAAETHALSAAVKAEACRGCPAHHACWKPNEERTGPALRDLIAQARREGRLSRHRLNGFWATGCHRPGEVVVALNLALEALRRERRWREQAADGRGLVAAQLRGVAEIMERLGTPSGVAAGPAAADVPRDGLLQYQLGAAKRARPGRLVSGDTHLVKEIGHRLLIALSDGMGAGGAAARQSQAAISLLESLVDAGAECEAAVHAVNTALLLRNRDESFATLDVLLIDRSDGGARFMKIGGAPGYLVRGEEIMPIRGGGVPLGILRDVRVTTRRCRLAPGDVAVLISDGVWEARRGAPAEDWVRGYLAAAPGQDPGALAAGLVAAAADLKSERPHDDLTAVVVRLLPARQPAAAIRQGRATSVRK